MDSSVGTLSGFNQLVGMVVKQVQDAVSSDEPYELTLGKDATENVVAAAVRQLNRSAASASSYRFKTDTNEHGRTTYTIIYAP